MNLGATVVSRRLVIDCVCGKAHRVRNAEFAAEIIGAYIRGELHTVTPNGVQAVCILEAFKGAIDA